MDCVEPFIKYYYEDHFKNLKSWPEKVKLQNSEVHISKLNMSSVEVLDIKQSIIVWAICQLSIANFTFNSRLEVGECTTQ